MGILRNFIEGSTSGVDNLRAEVRADAKASGRSVARHEIEREVVRRMNGNPPRKF